MPNVHVRGGWPNEEPINVDDHEWLDWQWQTQALPTVLRQKGIINSDELRRGIESIPRSDYEAMPYHDRWATSIETLLIEKGILTEREIQTKVTEIERRWNKF